ncbi:duplicated homeodomain-like superfamily protein [Wolffia australiana]
MTGEWSEEENGVFEAALVEFGAGRADRWERIAELVPGKSAWEVEQQYRRLERDVMDIEAGIIEPPRYADDYRAASPIPFSPARSRPEERKKGVPWSEDEHKRFLEGLEKYGKGDWRSISRNAVVTRTPTQVASHAQKYFLRLSTDGKKERRRSSIHDVTRS